MKIFRKAEKDDEQVEVANVAEYASALLEEEAVKDDVQVEVANAADFASALVEEEAERLSDIRSQQVLFHSAVEAPIAHVTR